jgi:hypothetical protein
MELTPKEKAKQLYEKIKPHSLYWDCFFDEPLEENHTKEIVLLWVDEIQSQLIQLNSDKSLELFNYYQDVKKELETL